MADAPLLEFAAVMRRLRAECPWKRAQTHGSLARYLLEETYETLEALDTGDPAHLREELGDLLLQVYFHAVIAEEAGDFTLDDVASDITAKMRHRNPHVFGDPTASVTEAPGTPGAVNELWEQRKAAEKCRVSVVDGLPAALPALLYADKLLDRLERAGLPTAVASGPEPTPAEAIGDDLLAVVARARAAGVDPEQALRDTSRRLLETGHASTGRVAVGRAVVEDEAPELGPVPTRVPVEVATVGALVAEQFPRWSGLPVVPVAAGGWDNHTFRLGESMLVRLPSAAEYALAVEKEQRWLPELASRVSLPIPTVLGRGVPGAGFPHPWSIYGWLDGHRSSVDLVSDPLVFAVDLAGFVAELRAVDPANGPRPGVHNWYRGGSLRTFDTIARDALAALGGGVDAALVGEVWDAALAARWDGTEAWFHGDLAEGNLLLEGGRLSAVIDFGTCGVGDPACDLAVAWTMLDPPGRSAFRDHLGIGSGSAEWARGRGWALWKTLSRYADAVEGGDLAEERETRRILDGILAR